MVRQPQRLRVVYNDNIGARFGYGALGAVGDGAAVGFFHFLGEMPLLALEQVVQPLGAFEEAVIAADNLPLRLHAEVVQKGYGAVEHLGDAAALGGGVHLQHPESFQSLG